MSVRTAVVTGFILAAAGYAVSNWIQGVIGTGLLAATQITALVLFVYYLRKKPVLLAACVSVQLLLAFAILFFGSKPSQQSLADDASLGAADEPSSWHKLPSSAIRVERIPEPRE